MNLLIIRGLPGSGKSTFAKSLTSYNHVEADMYFMMPDGTYNFRSNLVPTAHTWCQKKAADWLENGENVVVSNTFSRCWEIDPYAKMAKVLNANFTVITMEDTYVNCHNVPEKVIQDMKARWERWVNIN